MIEFSFQFLSFIVLLDFGAKHCKLFMLWRISCELCFLF